jgi:hypothetical protein
MGETLTSLDSGDPGLVLRCECGATILAPTAARLVERARLHFEEFHPSLGAAVGADLILAMAEELDGPRVAA